MSTSDATHQRRLVRVARPIAAAIAAALVGATVSVPPAAGYGLSFRNGVPHGVEVGVVTGGSVRRPHAPAAATADHRSPIVCEVFPRVPDDPLAMLIPVDPATLGGGELVVISCHALDQTARDFTPAIWEPFRPPWITQGQLDDVVHRRVAVPDADVRPPSDPERVGGRPVWLHVGNWEVRTSTATAGDLSSTVRDRPVRARWSIGDRAITCDGPDLTWTPADPVDRAAPPGCAIETTTPTSDESPPTTGTVTVTWQSSTTTATETRPHEPFDHTTTFALP